MFTWEPSDLYLAEAGHFLQGYAITITFAHFGYPLTGALVSIGTMALKEFSFDLIVEKGTVKDGFFDLAWLTWGTALAFLVQGLGAFPWRYFSWR